MVSEFVLPGSLREFVEREVIHFAHRNPGIVVYVNPRPCCVPRVVAEYCEWGREWGRAWRAGPHPASATGSTVSSHSRASLFPVNGAVREESIHCKSVKEIATLVQKLADQSGLDVIRIRKPFHTENPSIQGQWHPFTNKSTTFRGLRPRELQNCASAQGQAQ